jgi:limonene-1,2-epoxide hydrolase
VAIDQEKAVLAFIADWESTQRWDAAQVERISSHMTDDARYHFFAWNDPFVGHDAIRDELLRQAPNFGGTRIEIAKIASAGQTVFVERTDWITKDDTRMGIHVVGVFEVTADGKIATYADYLDSREIVVNVRRGNAGAVR